MMTVFITIIFMTTIIFITTIFMIMTFQVNKKTRVKTDGAWVHMAQNNNNNTNNNTTATANKEGKKIFNLKNDFLMIFALFL